LAFFRIKDGEAEPKKVCGKWAGEIFEEQECLRAIGDAFAIPRYGRKLVRPQNRDSLAQRLKVCRRLRLGLEKAAGALPQLGSGAPTKCLSKVIDSFYQALARILLAQIGFGSVEVHYPAQVNFNRESCERGGRIQFVQLGVETKGVFFPRSRCGRMWVRPAEVGPTETRKHFPPFLLYCPFAVAFGEQLLESEVADLS